MENVFDEECRHNVCMQNNKDHCKLVERAAIRRVRLLSCIEQQMLKRLCILTQFYIKNINREQSLQEEELLEKENDVKYHFIKECVDIHMSELEGAMELEQLVENMASDTNNNVPESNVTLYKEFQKLLVEYSNIAKSTTSSANESKNSNKSVVKLMYTPASSKLGEVEDSCEDEFAEKATESKSSSTTNSNEKNDLEESNEYFNDNREMLQQRLRHNRSKRERQYDSLHLSRKKCNVNNNKIERTNNNNDDTLNEETNAIDILACIQPLNTNDNMKRSAENNSSSSSSSLELECEDNSYCDDGKDDNAKSRSNKSLNNVNKRKTKITNKSKTTSDEHNKEEIGEQDVQVNHIHDNNEEQKQSPECQNAKTRHTKGGKRDSINIDRHRDNTTTMMMKKQQQKVNIRKNYKSTRASHSPSPRCTPAQYWDITFPASLDRKNSSSNNSFGSTTPEHK